MSYGQPGDQWQQPPPLQGQWSGYGQAPPPVPQGHYGPPAWGAPVATDRRDHTTMAVIAWILTVITLLYFLPWAIAATRGRSNAGAIGLINFLLGWTFIGWIVALVMACQAHQPLTTLMAQPGYPPPPPPQQWGPPGGGWSGGPGWGPPR